MQKQNMNFSREYTHFLNPKTVKELGAICLPSLNGIILNDSPDRTTIYISHRLSTVKKADKIAVVEGGTIVEFGKHEELMNLNGRYAEFFTLQAQAFAS